MAVPKHQAVYVIYLLDESSNLGKFTWFKGALLYATRI